LRTLAPGLLLFDARVIVRFMSKAVRDSDEVAELKQLYDRMALAVERAAATMHIRGADSTAFTVEDTKCVALWDRIRALMPKE
jgi:hypothetical protein